MQTIKQVLLGALLAVLGISASLAAIVMMWALDRYIW